MSRSSNVPSNCGEPLPPTCGEPCKDDEICCSNNFIKGFGSSGESKVALIQYICRDILFSTLEEFTIYVAFLRLGVRIKNL